MSEWAVELEDVKKSYRTGPIEVPALRGISLRVAHGEFLAIAGPSGCGKTTLLNIIAGVTPADDGMILLRGERVQRVRRSVGYAFQQPTLLPWRTIRSNVELGLELRGVDKAERVARADKLLSQVGLSDFGDAFPHQVSGGMAKRAEIARVLAIDPELLLMDEPFGALDALTREQMNVELHHIWRETGTSVLFVTHSIPEAIYLSNRVAVMTARPGRIAEILTVDLPPRRDYGETMASPLLATLADRARVLLGAAAHRE